MFRSRGLTPWNATQEDNDVWDVLTWVDTKFGKGIKNLIGQYLPSRMGVLPSLIWATVPDVYKGPDAMTKYFKEDIAIGDTHLSDFDKGSSDEEEGSSSSASSSFWESDTDPDSASDMDTD